MNYRNNLDLAKRVHERLVDTKCENPGTFFGPTDYAKNIHETGLKKALHWWLDFDDASQQNTPKRVAKMYKDELFYGLDYNKFPDTMIMPNKERFEHPVILQSIPVKSMCEHHLMPIVGVCTVAYIPDGFVAGLSKFNQLVDFFCRRPQMQERLTKQIHLALREVLQTRHVAVYIKAKHMCVSHRGKNDHSCETVTYEVENNRAFSEFFHIARNSVIVD